jgi:hypothetical protein
MVSPAQEADSLQWFYRDYLKLPVTVGVVVDTVRDLASVDGRWRTRDTSFYGNWQQPARWEDWNGSQVVLLYDASGTLRFVGDNKNKLDGVVFRQILARAILAADPTRRGSTALREPRP